MSTRTLLVAALSAALPAAARFREPKKGRLCATQAIEAALCVTRA
jgi:hypothetical protein